MLWIIFMYLSRHLFIFVTDNTVLLEEAHMPSFLLWMKT